MPWYRGKTGLSPLARGTLSWCRVYGKFTRFIPAGAGNTTGIAAGWFYRTVYPRWRGEHQLMARPYTFWNGLSPLARGTPDYAWIWEGAYRFIPAGAGNTNPSGIKRPSLPVYPRWRGEHEFADNVVIVQVGLSPLARGTLVVVHFNDDGFRFIPAGAGNTAATWSPPIISPVYPRWRGEHRCNCGTTVIDSGLSPLARGTPSIQPRGRLKDRFIPAGAGNTLKIYN